MRIWEDCDDECLPHICVDVSLCELQLAHLIATIPGCLVGFNVPTCGANAVTPFVVLPNCTIWRNQERMSCGQIFGEAHCWFIEAVSADTSSGWQVVEGIHVDVDSVFVELVGIRLCCPCDSGFIRMVFFGCALQKTEALNSRWATNGAQQHLSSMCCSSPAVSMRLHLAFSNPVMPIAPLIAFTLPFWIFLISPMKSSLVIHTEAPESQIALCALDLSQRR